MNNKKSQIWQMELKEVQRIKACVLKYINANQLNRGKDKNLAHTPEPKTPTSTRRHISPKLVGKSSKTGSSEPMSPFQLEKKRKNKRNVDVRADKQTFQMPKGYQLSSSGKILKQRDYILTQVENFQNLFNKISPTNSKAKQQTNIIINQYQKIEPQAKNQPIQPKVQQKVQKQQQAIPQLIEIKKVEQKVSTFVLDSPKQSPILEHPKVQTKIQPMKLEPINEQNQKQKTNTPSSVFNVRQLAKRFGGTVNAKPNQQPKIIQPPYSRFNTNSQANSLRQTGQIDQGEKSLSIASFGKKEKSPSIVRKTTISQFLGIKVQGGLIHTEREENAIIRKRSHTFQEVMPEMQLFTTKDKQREKEKQMERQRQQRQRQQKQRERERQRPRQKKQIVYKPKEERKQLNAIREYSWYNSKAKTQQKQSIKPEKSPSPQLKTSIKLTQEQKEELKNKYKLLSLKLDSLKRKVLEQCQSSRPYVNISEQKMRERQALRLYHKYSPLKKLNKLAKQNQLQKQSKHNKSAQQNQNGSMFYQQADSYSNTARSYYRTGQKYI